MDYQQGIYSPNTRSTIPTIAPASEPWAGTGVATTGAWLGCAPACSGKPITGTTLADGVGVVVIEAKVVLGRLVVTGVLVATGIELLPRADVKPGSTADGTADRDAEMGVPCAGRPLDGRPEGSTLAGDERDGLPVAWLGTP